MHDEQALSRVETWAYIQTRSSSLLQG